MKCNKSFSIAKKAKKDEFYTRLDDISNELCHYKEHFKDKVVFCNCDDPYESNFFKYFALNFNEFKLKKLISVSYADSPIAGEEVGLFKEQGKEYVINGKRAYKAVLNELKDVTGDGCEDLNDVREIIKHRIRYLKGNGDFRSNESIELLKQADIVVTNPPFSLFREYVAQLMKYNKKFIIWGNENAVTYKEIFPLIKENKIWIGYTANATKVFQIPNHYKKFNEKVTAKINDGNKYCKVPSITVFTNLDIGKRYEELNIWKKYNPQDYPKYDNYDAINVDKVSEIPCDYDGVMGVPITYLDKHNPDQFEILGMAAGNTKATGFYFDVPYKPHPNDRGGCGVINGNRVYARILIKWKG